MIKTAIFFWRIYDMNKNAVNIAKGIGIGVATGVAVAAVGSGVMNKKSKSMKNMKKTAGKAVHTMGEMINSFESMLK